MHILMLNNEFPPLGGGTGTVNREILRRLAAQPDLSIDLLTSALGRNYEQQQFAERIRILKVPVNNRNIHHSSNRELLTYAARALPAALKLHRKQPYAACLAWSAVPAGALALALHRLIGLPYVLRVCGPDIPGFEQRYGLLYPLLTPVIKASWAAAGRLVAKCQAEADMMLAIEPNLAIDLVPNGVDQAAFTPAPIADGGPFRVICVARLIERKGQHHLIAALKHLLAQGIDMRVEFVGEGDARAAHELLARTLGVAEHVQFSGYVPREEIAAHYAAAHAFVLPSYNEGMSVATLEAMAAGLPTVVTRTGGTAELLREGVTGLGFDWADVTTLTGHLQRLASDRSLARQMGAAARRHAHNFSWDTAAHRYQTMLGDLAGAPVAEPV